ncbi:hypothetical protein [Geitlerinema calcuttense]|uniref:Uncharacterized protein n=1 Tax=Geitlerinema calcuttense NRMC-F 0142 TaxID=2922238 RepID=A0ABT7LZV0_9CYAN|nr:hypothetical protein [Geitlerinema calcuttense]MDL5056615.1 hypothetical protein [Geitlerinema calcuttense NRMC-F 0142]
MVLDRPRDEEKLFLDSHARGGSPAPFARRNGHLRKSLRVVGHIHLCFFEKDICSAGLWDDGGQNLRTASFLRHVGVYGIDLSSPRSAAGGLRRLLICSLAAR